NDWTFRMTRSEEPDLLGNVTALGRRRRANDDQRMRSVERGKCLLRQRVAGSELVAVAKDRTQCLWNRPNRRRTPCKVLVDGEAFKRTMQPLRPICVGVAIGDEAAIFEDDRLGHYGTWRRTA